METKENSIYFENKVTGEVVYLFWPDEKNPVYANYMTVDGIKSISYEELEEKEKMDEVWKAILSYGESLGICSFTI